MWDSGEWQLDLYADNAPNTKSFLLAVEHRTATVLDDIQPPVRLRHRSALIDQHHLLAALKQAADPLPMSSDGLIERVTYALACLGLT